MSSITSAPLTGGLSCQGDRVLSAEIGSEGLREGKAQEVLVGFRVFVGVKIGSMKGHFVLKKSWFFGYLMLDDVGGQVLSFAVRDS